MPIYDIICKDCGMEKIDVILGINEKVKEVCPKCSKKMERVCNCKSFELVYNNRTQSCGWSKDDYSTNQYWTKYNEAKANGESVRIPAEDGDGK